MQYNQDWIIFWLIGIFIASSLHDKVLDSQIFWEKATVFCLLKLALFNGYF